MLKTSWSHSNRWDLKV